MLKKLVPSRGLAIGAVLGIALASLGACADPVDDTSESTGSGGESSISKSGEKAADLLPQQYQNAGKIVFATNAPYAPLEYFDKDNKTLIGYDIDLGNAIAENLGVEAEWENTSFDAIIPGLQAKKYDVGMAGFSVEHERLGAVDFVSYYLSGGGFLIEQGSGVEVEGFDSLCGRQVAVQKGVSQVEALQHASKDCVADGEKAIVIKQLTDQNVVVLALKSGRAEVAVGDKPQVEYAAAHSEGLCVVSTYQTNHSIAGMAMPKGNKELTRALALSVNELIEDGTYAKIAGTWGTGIATEGAELPEEYAAMAEPWGVGPDGTVQESMIFTEPDQISPGHKYFYGPANKECSG